jgi:hypothetical protein
MRRTIAAAFIASCLVAPVHTQTFSGSPKITQVDNDHWKLLEDFTFTDKDNYKWLAPKDFVTDGASIPPIFWPLIGSPFTGPYVKAAIIHDAYCFLKSREWQKVHRTFYDAMIASGTPPIQAKIMYYAVYRFGPKWVVDKSLPCPIGFLCQKGSAPIHVTLQAKPQTSESEMEEVKKKIEKDNPDVANVEEMADRRLFSRESRIDVVGKQTDSDGNQQDIVRAYSGSDLYPVFSGR